MRDAHGLLERQRELERAVAAEEAALGREPKGWPAARIFFHVAQWRGRLRDALTDLQAGRPYAPPPSNIDEFNERELPLGDGLPLKETSARADEMLTVLIDLEAALGDRPFQWTITRTTGDALIRNSYFHPRMHLYDYWRENGDTSRARDLLERTADELRELWPSPLILGAALYNVAVIRVAQGREDEAIALLEEAGPMRPDILSGAGADPDLATLKGNPRFEALTARR